MKIRLLQVGKTQEGYLIKGIEFYENRMKNYLPFSIETIPAVKLPAGSTALQLKLREGEQVLNRLQAGDRLVLLDERGKSYHSVGFSDFIQKQMNQGPKALVFLIGGAYGFSDAVYEKADHRLSLSEMTFSHQLIRLIFMEQLYRAMTILHNHPYHHD